MLSAMAVIMQKHATLEMIIASRLREWNSDGGQQLSGYRIHNPNRSKMLGITKWRHTLGKSLGTMKNPFLRTLATVVLAALMAPSLQSADAATSLPAAASPVPDEKLAIYVGIGGLNGPGRVIQLDWEAKWLGAVELPAGPETIACRNDELIVCPRFHSSALFVDRDGGTGIVFDAARHVKGIRPAVSRVAVHPKTGDLVFSMYSPRRTMANEWNSAIAIVPANAPKEPRTIFLNAEAATPLASAPDFPRIGSIAITPSGQMLVNAGKFNGPGEAAYRFPFGEKVVFDKPFVPARGPIAGDPSSERWAVLESFNLSRPKITVHENDHEVGTASTVLESGVRSARIAYAPNGSLLYARDMPRPDIKVPEEKEIHAIELYSVDVAKGTFRKLGEYLHESTTRRFYQTGLDSLAIGKRLPWPVKDPKPDAATEKASENKGPEQK
jgi:hypothetical protein